MLETVEATIDTLGNVKLLEKVRLPRRRRALVTILEDELDTTGESWSLVGSLEILDEDLDAASREVAEQFNLAIERSGSGLTQGDE